MIEALLSISYLHLIKITYISPDELPYHHVSSKKDNLKAYSTSYTFEELRKIKLEVRIEIIDSNVIDINRSNKKLLVMTEKLFHMTLSSKLWASRTRHSDLGLVLLT